jgi:hypothetical protein
VLAMDEYYFSVNIDGERELCLAPLTDRQIEMSGQELGDKSGHFLFERCTASSQIEIIAQVLSQDAVLKLCEKFKMS